MQTFRITPVFLNNKFSELAGVSVDVLQELQVSFKPCAGERLHEMLDNRHWGDACDVPCTLDLRDLLG